MTCRIRGLSEKFVVVDMSPTITGMMRMGAWNALSKRYYASHYASMVCLDDVREAVSVSGRNVLEFLQVRAHS